jgi:Cof subfamily protein (haloacid dehalogenase superfamily)
MFISDIDGTLLNSEGKISAQNMAAIKNLKAQNIPVVLATGRNLFSVRKVFSPDFPIDYLIFSTGLGIVDWKTQKLIFSSGMESSTVHSIAEYLIKNDISFFLQNHLPDNHFFYAYKSSKAPGDFYRRLTVYQDFLLETIPESSLPEDISQLIAIVEEHDDLMRFAEIKDVNKVRSTSPLDHKSIWIEFFPKNISKGHAVSWLCDYLDVPKEQTISIGNDYNDLEMLEFTEHSYCVANAPEVLKERYNVVASNNQNGVEQAIALYLKFIKS